MQPGAEQQHLAQVPALVQLGPLVLERLDRLVERHVALVSSSIAAYGKGSLVPVEELSDAGRAMIAQAIHLLAGMTPPSDPFREARELGSRRAEEGLPLEALLGAFRLGGRVVWDGFVEASREGSVPVRESEVIDSVGAVWEVVDGFSFELSTAYREREAWLRRQDVRARQAALDALIDGRGHDVTFERDAATALGLVPDGDAVCVVARHDASVDDGSRAPEEAVRASGLASVWHVRSGLEFGVVAASEAQLPQLLRALRDRTRRAIGISPVFTPLREIESAFRLAALAARTIPMGAIDVVTLDDRLAEAFVAASPELARHLDDKTLRRLEHVNFHDRDTYLATIQAVLTANGSVGQAAKLLHCHRNTVRYRLDRLEELAGIRLDSPPARLLWNMALILKAQQRASAGAKSAATRAISVSID